jgi:hypothetical protein
MAILSVGSGQQFTTLAAAVAAAQDGDTIVVGAGTYTNDFTSIAKDLTIEGVGGVAKFVATVAPPNGKAIMVTKADVTIRGLEFTGAKVAAMNGAGIRYESGNLTIENSSFHHNQNGVLANSNSSGNMAIRNSEFAFNGAGDGHSREAARSTARATTSRTRLPATRWRTCWRVRAARTRCSAAAATTGLRAATATTCCRAASAAACWSAARQRPVRLE